MRISKDIYKLENGDFIVLDQKTKPPVNSKLWSGYNYKLQEWWFEGKKDKRTLEQIKLCFGTKKKLKKAV